MHIQMILVSFLYFSYNLKILCIEYDYFLSGKILSKYYFNSAVNITEDMKIRIEKSVVALTTGK